MPDTTFLLALAAAILSAASIVLHVVAPRTKNTWDDKLRDDVDEVLAFAHAQRTAAPLPVAPPRNTQAGFVDLTILRGLGAITAFGAILGLVFGFACGATTKSLATDAKTAVVNCTGQQLGTAPALDVATLVAVVNLVATERGKCTPPGASLDWKCVEADLLAQGKVLGGCALVTMVTAAGSPRSASLAATPQQGGPEFADFCARAAPGVTYRLSTGDSSCR